MSEVKYFTVQADPAIVGESTLRDVPGVWSVKEDDTSEHAYRASVRSIAQDAFDDCGTRASKADEYITEAVDSSWWVIYTHANIAVLLHSDNEDAWTERYDALPADDWLAVAAYCAMERDVQEAYALLASEDLDSDTDDDSEGEE